VNREDRNAIDALAARFFTKSEDLEVISTIIAEAIERRLRKSVLPAPPPYPHGAGCPTCLATQKCNQCGGPAPKQTRCTNGRCVECCGKLCQHRTQ
jgi:hypothetical protein